ncbi:calcium-binding protein, partial [bacterium]|nr:calcium-binding protein [bacterium]
GTSYTATFTPAANSTSNGVISVASGTFTDAAGNANATSASRTITVNTVSIPAASSGNDSLTGTTGNDSIAGLEGNDTLIGLAGNDNLDGGTGNDSMVGGAGDDTYIVDSTGDIVVENTGEGTDTVQTALASYTLGSNVENWIALGTSAATGTGNTLKNVMTGNAGANTIDGGVGNDTLTGGGGIDRFNITAGTDTVTDLGNGGADVLVVSANTTVNATVAAEWIATSTTANSGTANLSTNGFAVNLAAVTTGSKGFAVTNTGTATALTGSGLADTLTGGAGNDSLVGGAGNDSLAGGLGADSFVLAGNDTVVDFNSTQSDVVNLTGLANGNTVTFTTVTGTLDLSASTSSAAFKATAAATGASITGGAGADTLAGGAGNDSLVGGAGSDAIKGGLGNDVIILTESTSAADVIVFAGATGTAGTTARVATLGLDTITGINLGTATTALDKLQFSAADFGIASGTTVVRGASAAVTGGPAANTDGNFYIVTSAPNGTGVDLNGTAAGARGAIVFVGSATGTAGVDVYFTTNEGSFSTSTAVKIATLVGISTANINATDLAFVA